MGSSLEDMQARLAQLEAENEALKKATRTGGSMKVSAKGALSVYGLGRFPVTLYPEQWIRLLDMDAQIRNYIEEHRNELKWKVTDA